MKIHKLESFYIINQLKNHNSFKKQLLDCIDDMPNNDRRIGYENITKTDWSLPRDYHRKYIDIFYKEIPSVMEEIKDFLHCTEWNITNTWFNQYIKNDFNGWHNHPGSNFANVYYLELPEDGMQTEFLDVRTNKIISDIKVKEGDIITFPAHILHRSKTINSDKRKTIIAFNSCFDNVKVLDA